MRGSIRWERANWKPLEFREAGDKVYLRARLQLIGRRSGIKVDREWSYVFTVANGKLLRQVGFDQAGEALRSAGLA